MERFHMMEVIPLLGLPTPPAGEEQLQHPLPML